MRPPVGDKAPIRVAVIAALGILVVLGLNLYFLGSDSDRGSFGDMFGGANALFSGLAFVGVIVAILLQRQELQLQRQELKATRAELEGTRKAQESQNEVLRKQSFEGTFFQLLRELNDLLESIDLRDNSGAVTAQGRDVIAVLYNRFGKEYEKHKADRVGNSELQYVQDKFEDFYLREGHEFGHYFRLLYNIFKLIDETNLPNSKSYSDIVRARLSEYELGFLFYDSLTSFGGKFNKYIEKYHLLKHISLARLFDKEHWRLHRPSAYGSRNFS